MAAAAGAAASPPAPVDVAHRLIQCWAERRPHAGRHVHGKCPADELQCRMVELESVYEDAATRESQAAWQYSATSCMLVLHGCWQPTPLAKINRPACLLGRPVDGCKVDGLCGHLWAVQVGGPC